jgi:hypothetical protein
MNLEKKFMCLMVVASLFGMSGVIAVTDTGDISLTVTSLTQVTFTAATIGFGVGSVDAGEASATLYSNGTVIDGSWTISGTELVLVNTGTENVSIRIKSDNDADALIGGTNPSFQWKMSNGEASSCTGIADTTYTDVNVTGDGTLICTDFFVVDSNDQLDIDFKLVVPSDAPAATAATATITATATAV